MNTIQLEVSDRIVKDIGLEALQKRLYRFLEIEELRLAALKVDQSVQEADEDHDQLFEAARSAAWEEFKQTRPNLFS